MDSLCANGKEMATLTNLELHELTRNLEKTAVVKTATFGLL